MKKEDYLRSTYRSHRSNLRCTGIRLHADNQNRHELEEGPEPHNCEYQALRYYDSGFVFQKILRLNKERKERKYHGIFVWCSDAEFTYNGDKQELYEDYYGKLKNICYKD